MAMTMAHGVREVLITAELVPDDQLVGLDAPPGMAGPGLLLLRQGNHLRAWFNACPHAGRRLDYAPGQFLRRGDSLVCAAHGATIGLSDGRCVEGPGRGGALAALEVRANADGWCVAWPSEP